MRRVRLLLGLLVGAAIGVALGLHSGHRAAPAAQVVPGPTVVGPKWVRHEEPTPEPGFDPTAKGVDYTPYSEASVRKLLRRLGHRADYRIPHLAVAGMGDGPLAYAVIARPFEEFRSDYDPPRYSRLDAGQRAVYDLIDADEEILNGGLEQYWNNPSGDLAANLAADAHRVGAPDYEAVFRAADKLWGGSVPRVNAVRDARLDDIDGDASARLDDRYFGFQYHRRTALGLILGHYVRTHSREFFSS